MNPILRVNTAFLLTAIISSTSVMTGCKSEKTNPPASQNAGQSGSQSAPVAQNTTAPPQMSVDDVVAPIALYPDQLLAQILTASTNSQEVLDGGNWLLQNQNLKGDALTNAAKQAGFSPSMQYLMAFPQVLDNMCQQIDWTRQLGQAFQADQNGVMVAVQRKRAEAQQAGNLTSGPQMTVDTKKADNGQQYVEIKPADPQVVYVPEYNPVTIYNTQTTAPAPANTTTTEEAISGGVSTGGAVAIGLLSFGVGMAVGSAMHHDDYYPYPAWGYGGVYAGGRPYYPPPYRPAYAGYHPAYGYHPPSNYRWNEYNRNVNVKVNNSSYYGRYNNQTVNARPGVGAGNQGIAANNRPGQPGWKGQSTYQGARPNAANQKPGASMANANPRNQELANRPNAPNNAANVNRPNRYTGTGAGNLAANKGAPANRTVASTNMNRGGDRGYSSSPPARPANASAPANRHTPTPQQKQQARSRAVSNDSALSRGGSAKSEKAASSRGQASMGARHQQRLVKGKSVRK